MESALDVLKDILDFLSLLSLASKTLSCADGSSSISDPSLGVCKPSTGFWEFRYWDGPDILTVLAVLTLRLCKE